MDLIKIFLFLGPINQPSNPGDPTPVGHWATITSIAVTVSMEPAWPFGPCVKFRGERKVPVSDRGWERIQKGANSPSPLLTVTQWVRLADDTVASQPQRHHFAISHKPHQWADILTHVAVEASAFSVACVQGWLSQQLPELPFQSVLFHVSF